MKQIYLDSCILIAHYSKHKEEKEKKKEVKRILNIFKEIEDIELVISNWTIAEMMNVMLSRHKQTNDYVLNCESELLNTKRIDGLKIKVVSIDGGKKKYDCQEFIFHVRENILKFHSGVGDIMHSVIMKNNAINSIITFDQKEDFKKISGLIVIHPNDVKLDE
jgi:predicted nucleic acid-binding protein